MSNLEILGKRIKSLRENKNITQVDLASIINKDQQSLQRLEKGKVNPGYEYLLDIAEGLSMSISELLSFETEK